MRSLYQYILGSEFYKSCKLEGVTNLCLYYDSFLLLTLVLVANAFQNSNHFQNLRVFMGSCFQVMCMILSAPFPYKMADHQEGRFRGKS